MPCWGRSVIRAKRAFFLLVESSLPIGGWHEMCEWLCVYLFLLARIVQARFYVLMLVIPLDFHLGPVSK